MVASWRGARAPSCFSECYDPVKQRLDPIKYYLFRRKQRDELDNDDWLKIIASCHATAREEHILAEKASTRTGQKRKFESPEERIFRDPRDGSIKRFGPKETEWYRMYVTSPNVDSLKFFSKFRRRF